MSAQRVALVVAALVAIACELPASVVPMLVPPAPTLSERGLNELVVQTAEAAAARTELSAPTAFQTPTPIPTSTPIITTTPSPIPSLTPTFRFFIASPTRPRPTATQTPLQTSSSGGSYSCVLVSQDPSNGEGLAPNTDFGARWRVRNTGTRKWDENSSDYRYLSGDRMHQEAAYDFPKTVAPGSEVNLIVDMRAPKNTGTYTTRWEIRIGDNHFCTMRLTIDVE